MAGSLVGNMFGKEVLRAEVKEHIGFHYLLTEIRLYTLTFLEFNIFLKMY